ncbi:MAG: hypothetical protein KDN05_24340, partial [Verrucomicrobiae bacterium]|nr:hypothetical protein [Verrucomicrobiae bacterium]
GVKGGEAGLEDTDAVLRSGPVGHGQESILQVECSTPGMLKFRVRTASEAGDRLILRLNGLEVTRDFAGEGDWEEVVIPIVSAGDEVEWVFRRNSLGSSELDRVWLADVALDTSVVPDSNALLAAQVTTDLQLGEDFGSIRWAHVPGAESYSVALGTTPGGTDLSFGEEELLSGLSQDYFVAGLPMNGSPLYLRLGTLIDGAWTYRDATLTSPFFAGFDRWIRERVGYRLAADREKAVDSNGDGETNWAEYAFGGHPFDPGWNAPVTMAEMPASANDPDQSVNVQCLLIAEADVSYTLRATGDLSAWEDMDLAFGAGGWTSPHPRVSVLSQVEQTDGSWLIEAAYQPEAAGITGRRFFSLQAVEP